MDIQTLEAVATKFASECAQSVRVALKDVDIIICRDLEHAMGELREEYEDIAAVFKEMEIEGLPADCKGIFIGEPLVNDSDEEGEFTEMPDGLIILVAANIADEKEAALVLAHEVGHALGMTEEEVDAQGLGVALTTHGQKQGSQPTS